MVADPHDVQRGRRARLMELVYGVKFWDPFQPIGNLDAKGNPFPLRRGLCPSDPVVLVRANGDLVDREQVRHALTDFLAPELWDRHITYVYPADEIYVLEEPIDKPVPKQVSVQERLVRYALAPSSQGSSQASQPQGNVDNPPLVGTPPPAPELQ